AGTPVTSMHWLPWHRRCLDRRSAQSRPRPPRTGEPPFDERGEHARRDLGPSFKGIPEPDASYDVHRGDPSQPYGADSSRRVLDRVVERALLPPRSPDAGQITGRAALTEEPLTRRVGPPLPPRS